MSEELLGTYKRELSDAKREIEDLKKALDKREDDNKGYRDTLRERDATIVELQKQVPPEGSTVLGKADAERWSIAKETADSVGGFDKLKAVQAERDNLQQQLSGLKRRETIREAGFLPTKLERLLNGAEIRAEGEGEDRIYAVLTKDADGNEKPVPLENWAESEGITDLLNVARLEAAPPKQNGPRVIEQAGARKPQQLRAANADELYQEKQKDHNYRI